MPMYDPEITVDDIRFASQLYLGETMPEDLAEQLWSNETCEFIKKNRTDLHISPTETKCRIFDSAYVVRNYISHGLQE